jgi:hypothetical protein
LELSGRSLSRALDIHEVAVRAAKELTKPDRPFRFHDVIYGNVRQFVAHENLSVFLEPTPGDPAHANLVILQKPQPIGFMNVNNSKQPHQIYREIAILLETCVPQISARWNPCGGLANLWSHLRPNTAGIHHQ